MMRLLIVCTLLFILPTQLVIAQEGTESTISSPEEAQIVQGQVVVSGTVTVLGFSSYKLSFAYKDDQTQTWFIIHSNSLPVFEDELGTWDTTTLTDGDYDLRLTTFLLNGSVQDMIVSDIKVRNYSSVPIPTMTPTATRIAQFAAPTAQLIVPALASVTPSFSTPTPLPANPANIDRLSISNALGKGAIFSLLVFFGIGLLVRLRREQ